MSQSEGIIGTLRFSVSEFLIINRYVRDLLFFFFFKHHIKIQMYQSREGAAVFKADKSKCQP